MRMITLIRLLTDQYKIYLKSSIVLTVLSIKHYVLDMCLCIMGIIYVVVLLA